MQPQISHKSQRTSWILKSSFPCVGGIQGHGRKIRELRITHLICKISPLGCSAITRSVPEAGVGWEKAGLQSKIIRHN